MKTEDHPEFEVGRGSGISGNRPQHSPDPTLSLFHPFPQNYSSIKMKHNLFLANAEHIASIAPLPTLKWKKRKGEGCGKRNFTLCNWATCHCCQFQVFPGVSKASLSWIVLGKIESGGTICKKRPAFYFRRNVSSLFIRESVFYLHCKGWCEDKHKR